MPALNIQLFQKQKQTWFIKKKKGGTLWNGS